MFFLNLSLIPLLLFVAAYLTYILLFQLVGGELEARPRSLGMMITCPGARTPHNSAPTYHPHSSSTETGSVPVCTYIRPTVLGRFHVEYVRWAHAGNNSYTQSGRGGQLAFRTKLTAVLQCPVISIALCSSQEYYKVPSPIWNQEEFSVYSSVSLYRHMFNVCSKVFRIKNPII